MATSLAQQLKRLAVPETGAYKQDKKKTSILFDPKEAASIDRETFYEIGLSGLEELKAIDPRFTAFEKNLFNISSKNFERSVQTSEINEKIDEAIRKFLISLSPYFLLQASHKALEWVINRYHIHKYNKDEFMSLILPYHESKIFVRCLQILKVDNSTDRWNWLEPLQKPGIPLPKSAVFNHCSSNPSFLKFIWNIVKKSLEVFSNRPEVLTTLYSFYCSTTVGTLEHSTNINEAHITNILPGLLHTLTSTVDDLKAAGYMILAQLLSKVQLKYKVLKRLLSSLLSHDVSVEYETVLVLHLLFHTQENLTKVSETFLSNLSIPCMKNLCVNLSLLIAEKTDVSRLLIAFMSGALELLQLNVENLKRFNRHIEMLISEVNFDSKTAELLIKCTVDCYSAKKQATHDSGEDSDMEVVDEPDVEKISLWYSNFLKSLESKYPNEFDTVLKNELKQGENETKKGISEIIGFAPKLVDKLGDTFLFEKIYHQNASVRLEACKYLVDNFTKLSKKNIVFLRESITDRLQDEDPLIVSTLLSIKLESLFDLIEGSEMIDILKKIVSKGPNDSTWRTAVSMSLNYICLLEAHTTDVSLILSILPFLFPNNEDSLIFTRAVLQSYFMDEFLPRDITKECLENNDPNFISRTVFEHLSQSGFLRRSENDLRRIIYDSSKENNYKYKVMALVLYSFSLQKREDPLSVEESLKLLKEVNKYIECARVTYKGQYSKVTGKSISKVLDTADSGKFPLQVYTFFLSHLITDTDINHCGYFKPWILNTSIYIDAEFLSTVYEIILKGCDKKLAHIYSPLLEVLIGTALRIHNVQDNIEFIANFVIGALTQANTDEKFFKECDMVAVRSLGLLHQLVASSQQDINHWILTSDCVIMMILLALYSDIQCVRESTMEIVKIIGNNCDKKHFVTSLLNELLSRKQEIILDHEQVPLILYNLLSPDNSVNKLLLKTLKTPMKKSLDYIINTIVNTSTPFYVKYRMCHILNLINSGSIVTSLSNIVLKYYDNGVCNIHNIYESLTLSNIISRINAKTLKSSIENESVWNMICNALKYHNFTIWLTGSEFIHISVLMMQQIDEALFAILPHQHAEKIISLVIEAATLSRNTNVITTSTKLLKRLELNDRHVSLILQAMLNICESSNSGTRKRKSFIPPLSVLESNEWKCGNTLLECIQNKKKLSGLDRILPLLFKILKKCLEFEEQSPVEYTKQLVLTSILHCCQQLYPMDGSPSKPVPGGLIDVELIVMCIRGSQNPQTHHHALMLLSQAAYMIPNKVLHHIMAIFTFIGSSVLRHDDAYSFQIITRIIDTVIPILVKFEDGSMDEKKLHELEKRVIPVLRIFVDVALDIPEHRRLPLFRKLLETLNPQHFLWNFLCLLFESHIVHSHEDKKIISNDKKSLNKEQPIRRLDFAMSVTHEFTVDVIMQSCIKLMAYLKYLPIDKPEEDTVKVDSDPSAIFSVSSHTAKELRHFKYTIVTYINNLLSSPTFTQKLNIFSDKNEMETLYKTLLVSILTYIQVVSKAADQNVGKPQGKYWKVMLHHSYEILDNANAHLPADMFVIVVRGLMSHNLPTVRRKSMEILNTKLQHYASFFADCQIEIMYSLLEPLTDIISEIDKENIAEGLNKQELELNQQTALLSLKLLVRLLAQESPERFQSLLDLITNLVKSNNVSGNLMASVVLCLAELCGNLKAHAIAYLPKFMPPLLKLLKAQNTSSSTELVLLSIITAVYKIVEILPQFLSPYLEKLLYEFSTLTAKWDSNDLQKKNTAVVTKLVLIRNKLSSTIAPRVLIPVVSQCYSQLIRKGKLNAIGPAMQVLAESFAGISSQEFTSLQQELTAFFLIALQFRNDYENELSEESVNDIEDHVIKALVSLILKLSESSFRPLYFKIYDWAVRLNDEDNKERTITFYRLSSVIAENLKGLFILFAGHFIKNAADLLDKCNTTKNTDTFFDSEEKCCILIESIVKTLHPVFQYDSQNFVNKERFETIMQPLVDQLDNEVGGMEALKTRARNLLIPCITQFGIATADDSLWKPLNYQILLKTRHNDSNIRLLGLECMCEMASKLGESWLPLLPESVPFLAELLEDEVKEVESATQKAVQTLEAVLGEPLQKYF